MAKRKKKAVQKRSVSKPESSQSRLFTYSLPVHFTFQFTFRESEILDPDADEPEISEDAITELEEELTEHLGQNYAIERVTVLDDALESTFLGKSPES